MNEGLKSLVDEAIDLEVLIKAAVNKEWTASITDVIKVGSDLPVLISKAPLFITELQALMSNPSSDADLFAYIGSKLGSDNIQTQNIILSIVDFLMSLAQIEPKAIAISNAIKAFKAGPAPLPPAAA